MRIRFLFLLILGAFLQGRSQSLPSYVPTNGLIGWWPFKGNADDDSGNNHHGTVPGAVLANDRNGNANGAYEFDYTNWIWGSGGDSIFVPHDSSFLST